MSPLTKGSEIKREELSFCGFNWFWLVDKKEGGKRSGLLSLAFLGVSRAVTIILGEGKRCSIASGEGGGKMPPPRTEEELVFASQPAPGTREPSGSMEPSQRPGLEACGHYFP